MAAIHSHSPPPDGQADRRTGEQQLCSRSGQTIPEAGAEFSLRSQGKPTTYQPSTPQLIRVCPDCAGPVVRSSGCINCTQCGWGKCG